MPPSARPSCRESAHCYRRGEMPICGRTELRRGAPVDPPKDDAMNLNVSAIISIVGMLGQLLSVFLFQKIRIGLLESEKRILDEVAGRYVPRETANLGTADHERRIARLE